MAHEMKKKWKHFFAVSRITSPFLAKALSHDDTTEGGTE
jgi:hypothetical protein